jgi:hypothetical protein
MDNNKHFWNEWLVKTYFKTLSYNLKKTIVYLNKPFYDELNIHAFIIVNRNTEEN